MAIQQPPTLRDSKAAIDWYQEKMQSAAGGVRAKLLRAEESQTGSIVLGKLFFFRYDPKWKAILPIYDIYPLVFPIERYSDGFLGLNIHYLSIPERTAFVNQLSGYATAKHLTPQSKLRMTYGLLMDSKKLASAARPCIKRYLWNHVRSRFIEIPATEWDRAAALPIELFVVKK